jgi:outer membrane protein
MQDKYNNALHDSIQNFLASYNKTHKYDYILSKSGDNILLANPKMNITEDVIKGLNKRYKKTEKK